MHRTCARPASTVSTNSRQRTFPVLPSSSFPNEPRRISPLIIDFDEQHSGMMPSIRLLDTLDWILREFELGSAPPYLAVSHAWSDHIFPPETPIFSSLGGKVVQKVIGTYFPTIHRCWVDNFCIKQDDEDDKLQQIPLMGSIYHNSEAVIVVLSCEIRFVQDDVDAATRGLTDALQVWRDQSWAETHHAEYFQRGPGRRKLIHAMKGLARFTCSTWATRI